MEYSQERVRLWTKDFILLMAITVLAMTAITTQMGTLPLFVAELGGSKAVSGIVVGILGISALFVRFPIGFLLDKYGRRLLLITGLFILLIDFTLLNLLQTLLSLFLLRLLQGVGNSIQATSSATMTADLIPKEKLSVGLGYYSIAQSVPSAIGPLIGLTVVENYGFDALFRVALCLTACAFFLSFFVSESFQIHSSKRVNNLNQVEVSLGKNLQLIIPSVIMFLINLAQSGVVAFIAQFASERDISGAGYYFTFMSVVTVSVRIFLPMLFEKINPRFLIQGSILLITIAFGLIGSAHGLGQLLLSAVLYGVGIANLMPMMNTIVLQSVSDNQRGKATAIFMLALDVAYGGGAMLWGFVATFVGFSYMYAICTGCGVLAWLIYFLYQKKI